MRSSSSFLSFIISYKLFHKIIINISKITLLAWLAFLLRNSTTNCIFNGKYSFSKIKCNPPLQWTHSHRRKNTKTLFVQWNFVFWKIYIFNIFCKFPFLNPFQNRLPMFNLAGAFQIWRQIHVFQHFRAKTRTQKEAWKSCFL